MQNLPKGCDGSTSGSSNWLRLTQNGWSENAVGREWVDRVSAEWAGQALPAQYRCFRDVATWLVVGGRGSGKTRLGAEWVNGLARGFRPFADWRHGTIALVGESFADVREVMIDGPSGIRTISRGDRPRFEATRRRLVWANGAVAQIFSSEDPESLRGPQFEAAWLDELGCPAIDKGPNQPNVFADRKSSESAAPYFSSGGRSDIAQQRFIEAHFSRWDEIHPDFDAAQNPVSPVYGERMVDASRTYLWAWDARPFPAFPLRDDRWADGGNWHYGHWLNGRVGAPGVGDLINAILADHGLDPALVEGADGTVHGYVVADPASARAALEPITELFGLSVVESADRLVFMRHGSGTAVQLDPGELVSDGRGAVLEKTRTPDHQLPTEASLSFREPFAEYQTVSVRNVRFGAPGVRQHTIGFPGVLEAGQARALAGDWMRRIWSEREQIVFSVTQPRDDIVPGATIRMVSGDFLVTEVEDGLARRVTARQIARTPPEPWRSSNPGAAVAPNMIVGQPLALFLDLPSNGESGSTHDRFRLAAWQKPWKSQTVFASPEETGFVLRATLDRPADLGELAESLGPGFSGRTDHASTLTIALLEGEPASVSRLQLLNGANSVAIRSLSGDWEIVQFEMAEEIEPQIWRMSGLLRGQLGTEDSAAAGAEAGAYCVFLDDAVRPAGLMPGEAGLILNWRVGPAGSDLSSANFTQSSEIGGVRAQLPLAPVHLRAAPSATGDLALSWIRRGRVDADNWTATDIPLGEDREEYQVEIAAISGAVARTATVALPGFLYQSADIAADFAIAPAEIDVTIRQLSLAVGWGLPATRRFPLP